MPHSLDYTQKAKLFGTENQNNFHVTFFKGYVQIDKEAHKEKNNKMATHIHPSRKKRLIKLNKRTKWAPFWTVFKIYGKGRRVHPSRHTVVKRSWRRTKTKA